MSSFLTPMDTFRIDRINDLLYVEESFWDYINYGVSTRAIDMFFGSRKKLEQTVKSQLKEKYGITTDGEFDKKVPLEKFKKEVDTKINKLAAKMQLLELKFFLIDVVIKGAFNAVINGIVNAIISLVINMSITEALGAFFRGFIIGYLLKIFMIVLTLVYVQVKMRFKKDPYATISFVEGILISLVILGAMTASMLALAGQLTIVAFLVAFIVNIVLSILISLLFSKIPFLNRLFNKVNDTANNMKEKEYDKLASEVKKGEVKI
jgi:hypothetical protein